MKNQNYNAGFTLMEMVISVGIFSVLVASAISIMIAVSNAQIKAANIQEIQDNARFSFELLTKELRTGSTYIPSSFCTAVAGEEISFVAANGGNRLYFRSPTGQLMRWTGTATPTSADCVNAEPISSDNVTVERFSFIIRGTGGSSDGQATITIAMRVKSLSSRPQLESTINLQTTIVQRLREI